MLHTTEELFEALDATVVVCGAGSVGANVTESLVRAGVVNLTVIDRSTIDADDLRTQPYGWADIGGFKGKAIAKAMYRATGAEVHPISQELTASNIGFFINGDIVVDTFSNGDVSALVRDFCRTENIPCLSVDNTGEFIAMDWLNGEVKKVELDGFTDPRSRAVIAGTVAASIVLDAMLEMRNAKAALAAQETA